MAESLSLSPSLSLSLSLSLDFPLQFLYYQKINILILGGILAVLSNLANSKRTYGPKSIPTTTPVNSYIYIYIFMQST